MRSGYRSGSRFVLVWAVLVSPLVGCSAETPSDRQGELDGEVSMARPAVDVTERSGCELLTAEEIEGVMGEAPDTAEEDADVRGCNWYLADGRPLIGVVASVAHRTYEEYMQNIREQLGSDLEDLGMSRVEGVGDYAVWHDQRGASYLNAVQDGRLLSVVVFRDPTGDRSRQEAAVELARKALPRL